MAQPDHGQQSEQSRQSQPHNVCIQTGRCLIGRELVAIVGGQLLRIGSSVAVRRLAGTGRCSGRNRGMAGVGLVCWRGDDRSVATRALRWVLGAQGSQPEQSGASEHTEEMEKFGVHTTHLFCWMQPFGDHILKSHGLQSDDQNCVTQEGQYPREKKRRQKTVTGCTSMWGRKSEIIKAAATCDLSQPERTKVTPSKWCFIAPQFSKESLGGILI